jgi:choline-glycine betaine transporter
MLPISWVIDLICVFAAITSLNTAITGNVYSAGRGKRRLVATVKSMPVRVALLCTSIALFTLFYWLLKDQISHTRLE